MLHTTHVKPDRSTGQPGEQGAPRHGGNLSLLTERYPDAPRPFLDLSTGISPYPYPLLPMPEHAAHRLPDAQETAAVTHAIAMYHGLGDASRVVPGAGMQPLMFALAARRLREHGRSRVALLSPSYTEHARVWAALGHEITYVTDPAAMENAEVAILANPNNPDGRRFDPDTLKLLARRIGWLIVDESFGALEPELSLASFAMESANCAVLGSCGKFFGLAGLRASWMIGPSDWAEDTRACTGPWPLSTFACHVLPAALNDTAWVGPMRAHLTQESAAWRAVLSRHFTIIGHTPLFTLVEAEDTNAWHAHLAQQGILVRAFGDYPRRLRFGLPPLALRARVEAALAQTLREAA